MNEENNFSRINNFILKLLIWEGVITILLLSFFCYFTGIQNSNKALALTINPSVTTVSLASPSNLTATAISSSQINLSWSSISGASYYKIYRGGNLTATTTAVSYSDTGLSPSTTYTYTVSAVDGSGGESAQSSSASATTLAAAAEETGTEELTGGPTFFPPPSPEVTSESLIINNNLAYTNSLNVVLAISTENAAQMAISNTPDFAGVVWENYSSSTEWVLTKGDGKKTVYAKFRSLEGGTSEVISDSIILDTVPPINVNDFEALAGDEQITLTWKNPSNRDFKGVRITGSTVFYPSSPSEGIMVYSGKGASFVAIGLTNGRRYYYTAFSYDEAGNYSSGAIVSDVPFKEKILPPPPPPPPPPPLPEIEKLTLEDFDFWQEGKKIPLEEKTKIEGKMEKPLTVSIDYEKVPEVLKTIMVTLENEGKSFSFLLRINSKKTRYEAVFSPPEEPGIYNLTITVLDYKNQALKKIYGYLEIIKSLTIPMIPVLKVIPWYKKIIIWIYLLVSIITIITATVIIRYLVRREKDKEEIKNEKTKTET